ncbi:hypothetical protein Lesp02_04880 [Lentzea sp. NBRC 105346]|uniref:alpha/beta fold hydrolase n=1 Tax=Lentzea sp. NBRC 105346 TaxID=3032205 RepID=UPI0024A4A7E4|nr:alpha/beta fold hydrolase [Lentzea sp. NBRC 105346]GLZ28298.1 hypothetical protein Lesp02_04880 [Lentzea sp. NBRC 105346]
MANRMTTLCFETFGSPAAPPILLISGAAASMDYWEPEFCERLAAERYVIRFDHRDTGRSPTDPPGKPGYTGDDLVSDAVGLIDAVAGGRAHVVGVSMGGGIAQSIAVFHPDRVAALTLIATSPGGDGLPPPADRARTAFDNPEPEPDWTDPDAVVDYLVEIERPFAGRIFDEEATREVARRVVARATNVQSSGNHWLVVGDAGEDPGPRLGEVRVPTLVIHGTDDPLFPPAHGEALARAIPGARLLMLDGMGHQTPPRSTWDVVVPAILDL